MSKTKIVFVPAGGLGNRLKAIASALAMARLCGGEVQAYWFKDQGLSARFDELFEPLHLPALTVRDASLFDTLCYDRPRPHNLYIPRLPQQLLFADRMEEAACTEGMRTHFDFARWAQDRKVWLASHVYFMAEEVPAGSMAIFKVLPHLQQRIEERKLQLGEEAIGVHIRRTDNARSIAESPTEAFIRRMQQAPATTRFYVATDDEREKERLCKAFPHRVVVSPTVANRHTREGIEEAVVELFTLAGTRCILGSACSTFSDMAANIGHIPLEIIKKDPS